LRRGEEELRRGGVEFAQHLNSLTPPLFSTSSPLLNSSSTPPQLN